MRNCRFQFLKTKMISETRWPYSIFIYFRNCGQSWKRNIHHLMLEKSRYSIELYRPSLTLQKSEEERFEWSYYCSESPPYTARVAASTPHSTVYTCNVSYYVFESGHVCYIIHR